MCDTPGAPGSITGVRVASSSPPRLRSVGITRRASGESERVRRGLLTFSRAAVTSTRRLARMVIELGALRGKPQVDLPSRGHHRARPGPLPANHHSTPSVTQSSFACDTADSTPGPLDLLRGG